jgi:zinc transport system substrate-binding protein
MKYSILYIFIALLSFSCKPTGTKTNNNQLNVSILPQKYIVDKIGSNKYDVAVMVTSGNNHETYEPTARQMIQMEQAPLYLQLCREGFDEAWVDNLKSRNASMAVVDLSEGIELITSGHDCGDSDHHHAGVDPHVWISPSTMKMLAYNTFVALKKQFPADSSALNSGYQQLKKEIDALDNRFREQLLPYKGSCFMVYHPVLAYVARDYGLTELFIETEGKEPSVEQLKSLVDKARANQVKLILVQKEYDTHNAEIIAAETGAKIIQFDPMGYDWPRQTEQLLQILTHNLVRP